MKQILMFDSNPGRRDTHCRGLANSGHALFHYANGNICTYPENQESDNRVFDLICLHGTDQDEFNGYNCTGPIVYYGGDGGGQRANWIPRPVTAPSPLSKDELRSFVKCFFEKGNQTVESAVAHVWTKSVESAYALRLLCEAWQFVDAASGAKREFMGGAPENQTCRITIHAPATPADWFNPFGTESPTVHTAEKIAKLMGDAEGKALKLLMAVVNGGARKTPVDKFLETFQGTKQAATNTVA